jgi:hypothetical protein
VRHVLAGVAAIALVVVSVASASVKPSASAAQKATLMEVWQVYGIRAPAPKVSKLGYSTALCQRISSTYFKCDFKLVLHGLFTLSGRSKVHFFKYAPDVSLYQVRCAESGGAGVLCPTVLNANG